LKRKEINNSSPQIHETGIVYIWYQLQQPLFPAWLPVFIVFRIKITPVAGSDNSGVTTWFWPWLQKNCIFPLAGTDQPLFT